MKHNGVFSAYNIHEWYSLMHFNLKAKKRVNDINIFCVKRQKKKNIIKPANNIYRYIHRYMYLYIDYNRDVYTTHNVFVDVFDIGVFNVLLIFVAVANNRI